MVKAAVRWDPVEARRREDLTAFRIAQRRATHCSTMWLMHAASTTSSAAAAQALALHSCIEAHAATGVAQTSVCPYPAEAAQNCPAGGLPFLRTPVLAEWITDRSP